jgi:threonine dehydrogenase-like Zn-dependent dehydrogenase
VVKDSVQAIGAGGVVCLTGVGSGGRATGAPAADIAAELVLGNNVVVGTVNANKRHWYKGAEALARAERDWLGRLITRREKPENFEKALQRGQDDIKVVIQFAEL